MVIIAYIVTVRAKILHSRNVREGQDVNTLNELLNYVLVNMLEVDLLPELAPDVEALLRKCLQEEAEIYVTTKPGTKCDLCPFRILLQGNIWQII